MISTFEKHEKAQSATIVVPHLMNAAQKELDDILSHLQEDTTVEESIALQSVQRHIMTYLMRCLNLQRRDQLALELVKVILGRFLISRKKRQCH